MLKWWIRFKNEWLDYVILGVLTLSIICWFNMDNIIAATGRLDQFGLFVLRDFYNSYNGGEYMKWLTRFLDRVAEFLITGIICTLLAGMWVYVLLYM